MSSLLTFSRQTRGRLRGGSGYSNQLWNLSTMNQGIGLSPQISTIVFVDFNIRKRSTFKHPLWGTWVERGSQVSDCVARLARKASLSCLSLPRSLDWMGSRLALPSQRLSEQNLLKSLDAHFARQGRAGLGSRFYKKSYS